MRRRKCTTTVAASGAALQQEHGEEPSLHRFHRPKRERKMKSFHFSFFLALCSSNSISFERRHRLEKRQTKTPKFDPLVALSDIKRPTAMQLPRATRISSGPASSLARKPPMSTSASTSTTPRVGLAVAAAAKSSPSDVSASAGSAVVEPPPALKKVAMVSLGCPKNTVDGEGLWN